MESCQVLLCNRLDLLAQSLRSIKPDVSVCVLSCLSNFISSAEETSASISPRVNPVLDEVFSLVNEACQAFPDRKYLISPPMYRKSPLWYRDGLSEIMSCFSKMSESYVMPNLALLPSFSNPAYENDGVHLTPYSGLEFVLHLFNSSKTLLASLDAPIEARQDATSESARLLEDRVVALEQDHRRLSSEVDLAAAIKAEFDDVTANERTEDSFIISGMNRISGEMTGIEWQTRAKANVEKIIVALMGPSFQFKIEVVHNSSGPSQTSEATYSVQMSCVADARAIRSKFSSYFRGGTDARPPELSRISIQNLVTRATRIRISITKLIGKRYLASNPGAKIQVIGYLPRPVLKVTPPPESKNKRIMSYNFIEAIQKFPTAFTKAEVGELASRAAVSFPGKLRSLFVVLSDDMVSRSRRSKRPASPSGQSGAAERRQRNEADADADADDN